MSLMKMLIKPLKNYKFDSLFLLKHYYEATQTSLIGKSHLRIPIMAHAVTNINNSNVL